jgi:hypothetical protein
MVIASDLSAGLSGVAHLSVVAKAKTEAKTEAKSEAKQSLMCKGGWGFGATVRPS